MPAARELTAAGVPLPAHAGPETVYSELLLKPLFSFAGQGNPVRSHAGPVGADSALNAGPTIFCSSAWTFVPTIETPHGLTQAEIRILYLWPDGGNLTPALSLVRLGRGKMMGVDHNRNQEWVGASAAFFPACRSRLTSPLPGDIALCAGYHRAVTGELARPSLSAPLKVLLRSALIRGTVSYFSENFGAMGFAGKGVRVAKACLASGCST